VALTSACTLSFSYTARGTPHIYSLSLHDALPISYFRGVGSPAAHLPRPGEITRRSAGFRPLEFEPWVRFPSRTGWSFWPWCSSRSEEHTSELQSRENLVCRLLLEKKKLQYCSHRH